MKNSHRLQAVGVLLLTLFGWLVFDLGSVKAAVFSYLDVGARPHASSEERAVAPPMLVGYGTCDARASAEPGAKALGDEPQVIAVSERDAPAEAEFSSAFAAVQPRKRTASLKDLARAIALSMRQREELSRLLEDASYDLADLLRRFPDRGLEHSIECRRLIDRYSALLRGQLEPEQQSDFDAYDLSALIDPKGAAIALRAAWLGTLIRTDERTAGQ